MALTTLQSLNHCCAFEREKREGEGVSATGLAALGGAVAKGRALLSDGWMDGLLVGATYRSTKCDEANLPKLLEVQTMFSVTTCRFIIYQICLTQIKSYQP